MKQIAIYGKGGIGKSTTVANIAASMSDMGLKVMVVGCDPKADSVRTLTNGRSIQTVLNASRESQRNAQKADINELIYKGYKGTLCVESGGPEPGVGCAGRGIITAIELLKKVPVFENREMDIILYDVLGDVVCGGFAMPIRMGLAEQIYTITSGEFMSVYAANNICKGIKRYASSGGGRYAGIICNSRNVRKEVEYLKELARKLGASFIYSIPRDKIVHEAEMICKTVIEHAPDSEQALHYKKLAKIIVENDEAVVPNPLSDEELEKIFEEFRASN